MILLYKSTGTGSHAPLIENELITILAPFALTCRSIYDNLIQQSNSGDCREPVLKWSSNRNRDLQRIGAWCGPERPGAANASRSGPPKKLQRRAIRMEWSVTTQAITTSGHRP